MQIRTHDDEYTPSNHLRGLAMLVPDLVAVSESLPLLADVILEPGAQTSTHDP